MAAKPTELTVIVPTWNRLDLLQRCLSSLRRQTTPIDLLVVDDGSTDNTLEWLSREHPGIRTVRLPFNQGFARAVNHGLRLVTTPFVALLNNDAQPESGWAEAGLSALGESPEEVGFFACKMLQYHHPDLLDGAGDQYSRSGLPTKRGFGLSSDLYQMVEEVLGASAGASFYRMKMLREIGLFDESYVMYLEDVELSLRARVFGYRCLYLPDAVVRHWEAASDPGRKAPGRDEAARGFYSDRRVFWITRNRWLLMITYQPLKHLPFLTWGWLKSLLFHLVKAGHLWAFLRGIGAGLQATPTAWRKRRELERRRPRGIRRLCQWMHR